jgi:hypothetical protein
VVCANWVADTDLCCAGALTDDDCAGVPQPLTFQWTDAELIEAASNLLYARTCFRYPGLCGPLDVWPCHYPCRCRNWCQCGPRRIVELPSDYPIDSIVQVEIDGVVMPPADYRLDKDRWLVRLDGEPWPYLNNFGDPFSGEREFRVQYITGRVPPIELRMAAAELACELKRACEGGGNCSLPAHATSVARRGVAFELQDITELLKGGLTGNPIIDHALKVHGNCPQHGRIADPLVERGYGVT